MERINQIQPSLGEEEKKELMSVIDSGWFTEAGKTREFEKMFADFVGSKYAVVVTSGTAALYIALKAANVKENDHVIVPDLTFVASPNSVEMLGGKPILVDIETSSLNLDISKLKKLINKNTKAIMPVDFNGRSAPIEELQEIASQNNIPLVEDACHAIGSFYGKNHMGTLSDVGVFSFSTPKIITTGQGGMIVTNNKKIHERCLEIKDFGRDIKSKKDMKKAFEHTTIGYNFKFTEFQAAVGIAQMKKLKDGISKKKKMMKFYQKLLSDCKNIEFVETDLNKITPWMIDILLKSQKDKERLIKFLLEKNIETRIFYPPIHSLPPYSTSKGEFPRSTEISNRGLWLPSSVSLTDENIQRICSEIIQSFN